LKEEETKAREEGKKMETINVKIQQKLENYQELYDSNQKTIYIGQKIEVLAGNYFNNKNKKELIGEFLKMVEIENSKRKKVTAKEAKVLVEKKIEVIKEIAVEVDEIRAIKKENKLKPVVAKPKAILKLGDRVRMTDGKAIGTIDSIQKDKATVNYGIFTSKVSLAELELVEAVKK
jgi:DNA mismatch repair protein MutS2